MHATLTVLCIVIITSSIIGLSKNTPFAAAVITAATKITRIIPDFSFGAAADLACNYNTKYR